MNNNQEARNLSSLRPPDPSKSYKDRPAVLAGFGCSLGGVWYRVYTPHAVDGSPRDARFFSSSNGRFDVSSPSGSLNLAKTHETALRERLGRTAVHADSLPSSVLEGVMIARIELPGSFKVADFRVPGPGIAPGDISGAVDNYSVTQQWAEQMKRDGFEGIVARSRFGESETLYLFGEAGEDVAFGTSVDDCSARSLVKDLVFFPRIIDVASPDLELDFE